MPSPQPRSEEDFPLTVNISSRIVIPAGEPESRFRERGGLGDRNSCSLLEGSKRIHFSAETALRFHRTLPDLPDSRRALRLGSHGARRRRFLCSSLCC